MLYTVAKFPHWNSHEDRKAACHEAAAYTKGKPFKIVHVYEVEGSHCRPVIAYVDGRSFSLSNEPWRPCELAFKEAFTIGKASDPEPDPEVIKE